MKFHYGDQVLLNMLVLMRFRKKDKISPSCIGLFEIHDGVGLVIYRLVLPPNLYIVHPVFSPVYAKMYHGD